MSDYVDYFVQQLGGEYSENAYYSLVEMDDALVPDLIAAYYAATKLRVKITIVEIVGEHRRKEDILFLIEAATNENASIWQAALDGLVKIGSETSVTALKELMLRTDDHNKQEWIEEAIQQIVHGLD
ncbi:MAG: HEAT repeat domain-containing protein [Anaerolineae bacterium]|nr:HEAT repeat domain-containing protein [Anaerolineae bacterium]MCB9460454.1 HEAT repeat domain-containing protein [Anaerolineaceae bacterium]